MAEKYEEKRSANTMTSCLDTHALTETKKSENLSKVVFDTKLNARDLHPLDTYQNAVQNFSTEKNTIDSDVYLQIGKEIIPAHWSVLCSHSTYFKRMYDNGMKEQMQSTLSLPDLSVYTVRKIIYFLYTAELVEGTDPQELIDMYIASNKYELLTLRAACAHRIMSKATADSVWQILPLATHHRDKDLFAQGMQFIEFHSDAVFQTQGWENFQANESIAATILLCFLNKD